MKCLTRDEQRAIASRNAMVSVGLEAALRLAIRAALGGDPKAAADVQQLIQYAPPETRERMGAFLERGGVDPE